MKRARSVPFVHIGLSFYHIIYKNESIKHLNNPVPDIGVPALKPAQYKRFLPSLKTIAGKTSANYQPLPGQEPYNQIDAIALKHDICYRDNNNIQGKLKCNKDMLNSLSKTKAKGVRKSFDKKLLINKKLLIII